MVERPDAEAPLQPALERMELKTVVSGARRLGAARRWMGPTAPANGLPKKAGWRDRGKLPDQALRILVEPIAFQQNVNPCPSIVVPGRLIVKAQQFRAIADQRGAIL
ncbi:MAG: hypothetical protein MO852_01875 [Candidatus Devosia euplotis]|nr:hypothetical protein [Candidatus Devosia euplotis]